MRYPLLVPLMLLCPAISAPAQVSIGVSLPGVSIGINQPVYPDLVPIPGYPVYYAPGSNSNYFFYDGMYWVYQNDSWYSSEWYNGPWGLTGPNFVPPYILRVPVNYYRQPPAYFNGWDRNAAPRWGDHWGHDWEQRRSGWDQWDRHANPAPAPLPAYQRQFSGGRYPQAGQQQALRSQNYHYQPKEAMVREHFQQPQRSQPAPGQGGRGNPDQPQTHGGRPSPGQRPQPAPQTNNRPMPAPESRPGRPEAPPQRPQAAPQRPQPAPQRPEAAPQHPQPAPQRPQAAPQRPEAAPQRPQAAPQRPEAAPQRPQAAPQRPQAAPQPRPEPRQPAHQGEGKDK